MKPQTPRRVLGAIAIAIAVLVAGGLSKGLVKSMWKRSTGPAPTGTTAISTAAQAGAAVPPANSGRMPWELNWAPSHGDAGPAANAARAPTRQEAPKRKEKEILDDRQ